jgi:hypothetical protein
VQSECCTEAVMFAAQVRFSGTQHPDEATLPCGSQASATHNSGAKRCRCKLSLLVQVASSMHIKDQLLALGTWHWEKVIG